jgi:hypothetical protein
MATILFTHAGVGAGALLHLPGLHTDDAENVFGDPLVQYRLKLGRLVVGARLRQRRRRPSNEHVWNVRLRLVAGSAHWDR